jgi:hypothetical protein
MIDVCLGSSGGGNLASFMENVRFFSFSSDTLIH